MRSDTWSAEQCHWSQHQEWTGVTSFSLIPNAHERSPEPEDILVMESSQGLSMEVFLTSRDIHRIQDKPEQFVNVAAAAAKRQRVEVKQKDLTPEEITEFQRAKEKEISQWLATETVARIASHKIPYQNVLRCRWVLTWKELDPVEAAAEGKPRKAKARLVILGYEDPNITELPRDSPTLQKESRSLLFQLCASRKYRIKSFDIRTAFLRGSRRDARTLGISPPEEMRKMMKLQDGEICELLKSAYGLVNAPLLWYTELKETLLSLNFVISPMDPCLFTLPDDHGGIHGALGVHVDDGLACGDAVFDEAIHQLEAKFPFGAKREKEFMFTGLHIHQDDQFNIHIDQQEYIQAITPIHIERNRRKTPQEPVTETERQELRGLIGSLQYASTNTRPDIAARLSMLQSTITSATIQDLLEGNRLLADSKNHSHVKVVISSIPEDEIRFVSYSDGSFATRAKQQSQKGGIILAAQADIADQKSALSSPLLWWSKKIDRIVATTLAAETYALSSAVHLLNWVRLSWEWLRCPSTPWKTPEEVWKQCPKSIAVVDCKSLFDVISKNTTPQCQEHRALIEALVVKSHLQSGIVPHWVHSAAQLADALTKSMDCYRLRQFLQHRVCCLHDVEEVLKQRADRRAQRQWLSDATKSHGLPDCGTPQSATDRILPST